MSVLCAEHEMVDTTVSGPVSPKIQLEHEKRLRREIANSNERRRMQSINSGFQSLKTLLPHQDGEKLSKAAILQHTAEYITSLEQEKTRLIAQNTQLRRMLADLGREQQDGLQASPPPKRKKRDTESSDEGISMNDQEEPSLDDIRKEIVEVRCQLDRERRLRMMLEEQTRTLEAQLYPERLRQIATQVQAQIRFQEEKERYLAEQRKMQEEEEKKKIIHDSFLQNSMSRRNLETIVEAIKHLEGDHLVFDDRLSHRPQELSSADISERENSAFSDQEDCKSQTSGRESPLSLPTNSPSMDLLNVKTESYTISSQRYPIAMQLLHRPNFPPQFYQRPGVIVQKSS